MTEGEDIFNADRTETAAAAEAARLVASLDADPNNVPIYATLPDPYKDEWVGVLSFDPIAVLWTWHPLDPHDNPLVESVVHFDIEITERLRLREDLSRAIAAGGAAGDALRAEVEGRITVHRDETRATAVIGAKIHARSHLRRYFDM